MTTKVLREVVKIDEDKCDGCGLCIPSCAEGAIQVIDGKARLVADNLCDGLGNCLGVCPQDAITVEQRDADAFDEEAVAAAQPSKPAPAGGCPGMALRKLEPTAPAAEAPARTSQLAQWPVQLHLLPPHGDIWRDADVLFAADCVPFAMPDFHEKLLAGKTLAIACPKLDDAGAYVAKLAEVFADNAIRSISVAHMEVPCCFGLWRIVEEALAQAGKADLPVREITVRVNGTIDD